MQLHGLHLADLGLTSHILWLLFPSATLLLAGDVNYLGPGSERLRQCAQDGIIGKEGPDKLGCADYACACQSMFSQVVAAVSTAVEDACSSNHADMNSAILSVYEVCTDNSFSPTLTITASPPTGNLNQIGLAAAPCANQLRTCAYKAYAGNRQIPFGCFTNDCLCRPDMFSSAISAVSIAALNACSGTLADMSSATQCVISYCIENGYSTAGTSVISPAAAAVSNSGNAVTATGESGSTTQVGHSTFNSPSRTSSSLGSTSSPSTGSSNSSSGGNGFTTPDIVGTVIGVFSFIAAVIGISWKRKTIIHLVTGEHAHAP